MITIFAVLAIVAFLFHTYVSFLVFRDLYRALHGESTVFDGPAFFPLKLYAIVMNLVYVFSFVYLLFQ